MERNLTNIKERILYYTDFKGISKEFFFKDLSVSYGTFKGKAKNQALSSDVLERITTKYPDISTYWLLTGKGDMIFTSAPKPAIIDNLEKELQGLKDKYYKLMEENHDLLVELRALESKNSKPQKAS